jgi:hypothetical protein
MFRSPVRLLVVLVGALTAPGMAASRGAEPVRPAVEAVTYRGWSGALRLSNAQVEAVVVPEVGRVMSFRFQDGENVLWEDAALAGGRGDPAGKSWVNFGGDKTWPSPEGEWGLHTKRSGWMPPPAFDGLAATARVDAGAVVLTSQTDPFYGVRWERRIALRTDAPVMEIATTYERVTGSPIRLGVWVITQFREPVAVIVPGRAASVFPRGYFVFGDRPWPEVGVADGWIRLTREPAAPHKLGTDGSRMLWIGEKELCLVESPRMAGAEYPDRGASAEVYTNPDPKRYVELETLGPLATLCAGERMTQTNTYTLVRRTSADAAEEARRVLAERR